MDRLPESAAGTSMMLNQCSGDFAMFGELSDREKDCLSWTASGKSSWEVGRILSISENTVVFHIKNAMRKLGAANRNLAALKAIELGLIQPAAENRRPRSLGSKSR